MWAIIIVIIKIILVLIILLTPSDQGGECMFKDIYNFGEHMQAFVCYLRGYQILISDCFGNPPNRGDDWSLSIYKRLSDGNYDDTETISYFGRGYTPEKGEKKARLLLAQLSKG